MGQMLPDSARPGSFADFVGSGTLGSRIPILNSIAQHTMTDDLSPSTSPVTDTHTKVNPPIKGWHAHVYFDERTVEQARQLCLSAAEMFPDLKMGRVHEKLVGPHPDWSCQLAFLNKDFAGVMSYLTMNRAGLTVFIHPITGQDTIDHSHRAIWMGAIRPIKLERLPDAGVKYDLF